MAIYFVSHFCPHHIYFVSFVSLPIRCEMKNLIDQHLIYVYAFIYFWPHIFFNILMIDTAGKSITFLQIYAKLWPLRAFPMRIWGTVYRKWESKRVFESCFRSVCNVDVIIYEYGVFHLGRAFEYWSVYFFSYIIRMSVNWLWM